MPVFDKYIFQGKIARKVVKENLRFLYHNGTHRHTEGHHLHCSRGRLFIEKTTIWFVLTRNSCKVASVFPGCGDQFSCTDCKEFDCEIWLLEVFLSNPNTAKYLILSFENSLMNRNQIVSISLNCWKVD